MRAAMRPAACSAALAALSLLVVRPAPSYDPWAWLLWGREMAAGGLSTVAGPAVKPLAMVVCAALSPFGGAAPVLWVLLARAAAVLAVWLAFRLARRLAGGSVAAGIVAAAGVALCGGYVASASSGLSEPLVLALALAAVEAGRSGRPRWALACAAGCGLLRVEAWPFLAVAAVAAWRRRPQDRPLLVAAALLLPAAWLVPELVGSGEPFRSAARARIPSPGQPALADMPVLAALGEAVRLPLWPMWAGVGVLAARAGWRRDGAALAALAPAAAGLAWIALVAAMARAGFSGEPRYALPGAALVSVSGAVGLIAAVRGARSWRPAALAATATAALVVVAAGPRLARLPEVRRVQEHQWALQSDLAGAVAAAGGRAAVLACGQPHVGRLRGPLLAYRLDVVKRAVEPDRPPRPPGMVFRSRLTRRAAPAPAVPPEFGPLATVGTWEVHARC